jgi:hypothetical protein
MKVSVNDLKRSKKVIEHEFKTGKETSGNVILKHEYRQNGKLIKSIEVYYFPLIKQFLTIKFSWSDIGVHKAEKCYYQESHIGVLKSHINLFNVVGI